MILMKEGRIVESGSKKYLREKYNESSMEDLFLKIIENALIQYGVEISFQFSGFRFQLRV